MIIGIAAEDSAAFDNARTVGNVVGEDLAAQSWFGASFAAAVEWVGQRPDEPYLPIGQLLEHRTTAWGSSSRRHHGQRDGVDLRPRIIADLFERRIPKPDAVVIALDIDRVEDRLAKLRNGVASAGDNVVLAAMNPEAEAWRIAAFEASDDDARARHRDLTARLTFDPVRQPERLRPTGSNGGPRDVKRCESELFGAADPLAALTRPVADLETTAASTGLTEYIRDIRDQIGRIDPSLRPRR